MLHIILCILKIIGWILLVMLAVILLVVGVFLLAPVRYRCNLNIQDDFKNVNLKLKFSWIFHLIRGQLLYNNDGLDVQVKIAWKTYPIDQEEKKAQEDRKDNTVVANVTNASLEMHSEQREEPFIEKKPKRERPIQDVEKEQKKSQKKEPNKLEQLIEKIKYTFQKICATIKTLQKKKDYVQRFLKNEIHKNAWSVCLLHVKILLRRVKPKKLFGTVEYGTDDPALTGQVLAFISMIYPFTEEKIEVIPDFNEKKLNADICVVGKIRSFYFLQMGIKLLLNKNVRITYKHIRTIINRI